MKKALIALPAIPVAAAAVVVGQVIRSARRSDLPSFPNQDPSGLFGDPTLPRLRIVAVGDSSLTAPGVADIDNIWIRQVARDLSHRFHVELISLAVGGSKAVDVLSGQVDAAVALAPDLVIISVGGNDALRGVPPVRYRQQLRAIVDRLSAEGRGIVIFGMGDFSSVPRIPKSLRPWAGKRSIAFDEICRQIAVATPRTVKVHTRGAASQAFFQDPTLFAGDLFHASDRGHTLFATEAREAIEAAIALRAS